MREIKVLVDVIIISGIICYNMAQIFKTIHIVNTG